MKIIRACIQEGSKEMEEDKNVFEKVNLVDFTFIPSEIRRIFLFLSDNNQKKSEL